MEKKQRKSLVDSLHDRSRRSKSFIRVSPKGNLRDAQYLPSDTLDILMDRLSDVETELQRNVKLQSTLLERVEKLERRMLQLHRSVSNVSLGGLSSNINVNNKNSSTIKSTGSICSKSYSDNSSNQQVADEIAPKISTWARITRLFMQRPSLESLKTRNIFKNEPCFDTEIENVMKHERYRTVPKIVVECVQLIESKVKISPIEGLYRVSGDNVDIQKIRFKIDSNKYECLREIKNVHTIIGVLKLFLREIKFPLVKESEVRAFIGSSREWTLSTITYKVETLQKLVRTLPETNRDTLCYFMRHLYRLSHMALQYSDARSLAISLTPTVFHISLDYKRDLHTALQDNETLANCLEIMIDYSDKVFENILQDPWEIL